MTYELQPQACSVDDPEVIAGHDKTDPEHGERLPKCELVAQSVAMTSLTDQIRCFANSSAPVLVTGENGTGKEVVSSLVHRTSDRRAHNYVRVNCAALSETLIESELFGHEKGAFTGASDARIGRFEWAGRGTILLDEISEIPVPLQAKLLRVLEEEEFQRVGGNKSCRLRARIVASSNRSLLQEVREGRFREDLFYRLNVLHLHIPPLRERRDDVPVLVDYFLNCFREEGRGVLSFSPAAMNVLSAHPWPGNVRQLRNTIRRVCILAKSRRVDAEELSVLGQLNGWDCDSTPTTDGLYEMTLRQAERELIHAALRRFDGNQTAAASHLGITPRTLHNRLKQDPDLSVARAA